jgi:alpha-glucosidase
MNRSIRLAAGVLAAWLACVTPALTAPDGSIEVKSPGGVLRVSIGRNEEGRIEYSVWRNASSEETKVLEPSRLGFILADRYKLERNLSLAEQGRRTVDETWEQPWGESRHVRNHFNELRVRASRGDAREGLFDVVFRVYDDGLGFRYEFAGTGGLDRLNIVEELTEFAIAEPATAW